MRNESAEFVGPRLKLARSFAGLTQVELGQKVAASAAWIHKLEGGKATPTDDLLRALGEVLGVEPEFFALALVDEFREGQCNFRHLTTTPERAKKRVLAAGTLLSLLVHYLRTMCRLPPYNVPSIPVKSLEEIEAAAEACRGHWNLGVDRPLTAVGRVLENAGVVLTRLNADTRKVDAFSRFGPVSVVVLNSFKNSPSRAVFDAAHEIGHLVMHTKAEYSSREREPEAHRFASAFLMPRRQFAREFRTSSRLDWVHLFELKGRWRASVSAIVHRAYDLKLLDAAQYRHAYRYIYAKGWHRGEPQEPVEEHPEIVGKALEFVQRKKGLSFNDVARALSWQPALLATVTGISAPPPKPSGVIQMAPFRRPAST